MANSAHTYNAKTKLYTRANLRISTMKNWTALSTALTVVRIDINRKWIGRRQLQGRVRHFFVQPLLLDRRIKVRLEKAATCRLLPKRLSRDLVRHARLDEAFDVGHARDFRDEIPVNINFNARLFLQHLRREDERL